MHARRTEEGTAGRRVTVRGRRVVHCAARASVSATFHMYAAADSKARALLALSGSPMRRACMQSRAVYGAEGRTRFHRRCHMCPHWPNRSRSLRWLPGRGAARAELRQGALERSLPSASLRRGRWRAWEAGSSATASLPGRLARRRALPMHYFWRKPKKSGSPLVKPRTGAEPGYPSCRPMESPSRSDMVSHGNHAQGYRSAEPCATVSRQRSNPNQPQGNVPVVRHCEYHWCSA